ncbi:MAG: TolB family protein [Gemmatimonadota bacterium]
MNIRASVAFAAILIALTVPMMSCGGDDGSVLPGDSSTATADAGARSPATVAVERAPEPGERRFAKLSQLTFEGENAEAYFSADGRRLIFQRRHSSEYECDQIFTIGVDGSDRTLVSTGLGRTTCSYFFPEGDRILYSSTHLKGEECPPPPDFSRGYVWALYDFDIFTARDDGTDIEVLFQTDSYDAEATISQDGSRIVFTSMRDGDLDIYSMNADGSDVVKLTDEIGYDGGPFYSADGSMIVYRAHYPETDQEVADYQALLADNLIRPGKLDIYIMNADGTDKRRITNNGAANFAPFFHPNGEQVIFASNLGDPESRNFDLFLIGIDGTGLEQVTFTDEFESFPMFTPDGKQLVFASNRYGSHEGNTNLFIAEWIDDVP